MTVYRATITGNSYGSIFQNVLHFYQADSVASSAAPALATSIRDVWLPIQKQFSTANFVYNLIRVDELIDGGSGIFALLPCNIAGAGGSEVRAVLSLAAVVQLGTGLAGRKNRGRFFVPIAPSATMAGSLDTQYLTDRTTQLNAWKAAYVNAGHSQAFDLVIHGPNDSHVEYRKVETMIVRPTPGSQRRRMIGVGI